MSNHDQRPDSINQIAELARHAVRRRRPAALGGFPSRHSDPPLCSRDRCGLLSRAGARSIGVGAARRQLGRTIGFPTANIALADFSRPQAGIYASISLLETGACFQPVLCRVPPTVDDGDERLEVFLCRLDEDIYGRRLETVLIAFRRPDERFASLEAMQRQMRRTHGGAPDRL